jgi:GT2 family glycosyltransferase
MPLQCSVVIPTYQRLPLLMKCLDALSRQTLAYDAFEIIIVDDGNQPAVAEAVAEFEKRTSIQMGYVGQPSRRGPAAARNQGWQVARSPVVAFTDDDCLPQPDWLSAGLSMFERGATVVTGQLRMPLPDRPTHHDRTTAFLETAEFITANCFCLRTALERVGGFEEAFDMAWREDSDLQFKLLRAGYHIQKRPSAVVIHPMREAPWYAPLRDERKNRYDALLFKRHPDLFRQRIPAYRSLVARYYATVVSFVVGWLALVVGNPVVAGAGFGAWLLLTGWLIAERWPTQSTWERIQQTMLMSLATPFLSVYWRLYGAVKYNVVYF